MGLLRAAEGFDPTMNTRFSTYACFWIKQSIKRTILNTAKTIRVPAYMAELLTKWRRAANNLADKLGRAATDGEIAELLGLSKKVSIIRQAIRVATAGAQSDQNEGGGSIEEMLMDPGTDAPGVAMTKADSLKQVLQLLEKMDRREATVLRMRFGLGGDDPKTLNEIGAHLGLTRERVRQIENEALAKLVAGTEAA